MAIPSSATQPTINRIDFSAHGIPAYSNSYAVVLDNIFSPSECADLISIATTSPLPGSGGGGGESKWSPALVNTGNGTQASIPEMRNCKRIILDSPDLASKIWSRVSGYIPELARIHVPARVSRRDAATAAGGTGAGGGNGYVKVAVGLNERLRFLKYGPGEYFQRHCDGVYRRESGEEFSVYTLHLYLNDGSSDLTADGDDGAMDLDEPVTGVTATAASTSSTTGKGLIGGATTFFSPYEQENDVEVEVGPKIGRVLVFQHQGLWHAGEEVSQGCKITMRTDIMYKIERRGSDLG